MSKLRDSLPDSLELLLDTMCNTFGGIMFIALALVIISQMVTDKVVSESPEKVDPQELEMLEHSVALLQKNSAADLKNIEKYKEFQKKASPNLKALIARLKEQETINRELAWQAESLEKQLRRLQAEKARLQRETADLQRQIEREKSQKVQKEKDLLKELAKAEKELKELQEKLSATKGKTIKFGMEEPTYKTPYIVLVHGNKIYRAGDDWRHPHSDVTVRNSDRLVVFIPRNGTALGNSPDRVLNNIFSSVDKGRHFIWLTCDEHSFHTLMMTREYLRAQGFMVKWDINNMHSFTIGNSTGYSASF